MKGWEKLIKMASYEQLIFRLNKEKERFIELWGPYMNLVRDGRLEWQILFIYVFLIPFCSVMLCCVAVIVHVQACWLFCCFVMKQ